MLSGGQHSRVSGVILALGDGRSAIQVRLDGDPYRCDDLEKRWTDDKVLEEKGGNR